MRKGRRTRLRVTRELCDVGCLAEVLVRDMYVSQCLGDWRVGGL